MSNTFLFPVRSVETTQFNSPIAGASAPMTPPYAASVMTNIPGVPAIGSRRFLIRAIQVIAKENFGPEVNFFSKAAGPTLDPATDSFIARFQFLSVNGEQIGGVGNFRYYIDGLAIPYQDDDNISKVGVGSLHVILQNVDVTAKSGDTNGATVVTVWLEPVQAW
jgi:hypothetical protein